MLLLKLAVSCATHKQVGRVYLCWGIQEGVAFLLSTRTEAAPTLWPATRQQQRFAASQNNIIT